MRMRTIYIVGIAILVGIGGWFIGRNAKEGGMPEPVPPQAAQNGEDQPAPQAVQSGENQPTPPDLTKPVVVSATLTEESRANAIKKIGELRADLTKQDDLYSSWLDLALQMKLVGEYREAETIWQYVIVRWPGEAVAFGNLANLYLYELQDAAKAEGYFLKAINAQPSLGEAYYQAYDFYRLVKKDRARAREILEQGIAVNPENRAMLEPFLAEL